MKRLPIFRSLCILSSFGFLALLPSLTHAEPVFNAADALGTSAQMIALGQSEGWDGSSQGLFENPAALAGVKDWSIASFYTSLLFDEVKYLSVSAAYRLSVGVIAVGRLVTQLDGLESTVLSGVKEFEPAGTFAYQHAVSKIGYQISPAEHLHVGVAATHIYTQLRDVIGHGLNLDAGFLWEMRPFSWSVSAKNILPFQNQVYSNGGVEDLPLHVATGLNVRFWELEAMAQLKTRESQLLKSVAARLSPSLFSGVMSFSGGVYEEAVLDRKNWRYGVGVGLNLRGLRLHYAYSPSQVYSQAQHHYFSMNLGL